ncbi:MAG: hypothetical protein KQJ78_25725 [Deltaproteobacteria bacterium]|nr:hypothetical protein [Deltaproteobacteria bacterium]
MNIKAQIKRSWQIVRNYRALWVLGIAFSLLTTSTAMAFWKSIANLFMPQMMSMVPMEETERMIQAYQHLFESIAYSKYMDTLVAGICVFSVVIILWSIFSIILKYIFEASLIFVVDNYESGDAKVSARQGFRLGWSKTALRLVLIDLAIFLPLGILYLIIMIIAMFNSSAMTLKYLGEGTPPVMSQYFGLQILIVIFTIISTLMWIPSRLSYRACALSGMGVFASIKQGFRLTFQQIRETLTTAMSVLVINAGLILLVGGLYFLPSYLMRIVFGTDQNMSWLIDILEGRIDPSALVVPVIIYLTITLVLYFIPFKIAEGVVLSTSSSIWTLAYKDMVSKENQTLDSEPEEMLPSG